MADTWKTRLDVTEALEADGWTGDSDNPDELLRKNGAVWALTNDSADSSLSGSEGWTIDLPSDVPDAVVIAACRAAAEPAP